ncbi:tRNA lysidine(34) synthetase TilS [Thiohalobacter thiocyanaticus]|nr:tRNA lysidine(34) synthetase TilS [Thiohalobacter thiocyanaticus]
MALSGGLDSVVLLHRLADQREQLGMPLGAVHVDHQLQPDSAHWSERCRALCQELDIPFELHRVEARPGPGESPEAAAREARYRALREWLQPDHCLVTAHHEDDQAETLLLQLLRGSGPRGLAGMPAVSVFGPGWLCRPLLEVTRAQLLEWARNRDLDWIEDPSNADRHYDRNFLRHEILPRLQARWPGVKRALARAARHQADAASLQVDLAISDLLQVGGRGPATLSVAALLHYTPPRRRNLLRYWLHGLGLLMPSEAVLEQIEQSVLGARADTMPRVHWPGGEVRRYRDDLYAMPPLPVPPAQRQGWDGGDVNIPAAAGRLEVMPTPGQGLAREALAGRRLQLGFRVGGERLAPAGRGHHHSLKHLFQERGIPPWERDRVPLVYCDDELVAVAGLWLAEGWQARGEQPGLVLQWSRLPG